MATKTGAVHVLDIVGDGLKLAGPRVVAPTGGSPFSQRVASTKVLDIINDTVRLSEFSLPVQRRAQGDAGYGSVPLANPIINVVSMEYSMFGPGDNYYDEFTLIRPDTGVSVFADSLPTVTVQRNGADTAAMVVTVTAVDTGRYKVSGVIPTGWARKDVIVVVANVTINSKATKWPISSFVLQGLATSGQAWP